MNYNEQMQRLFRSWTETQQKAAQQWLSTAQEFGESEAWNVQSWIDRWRQGARSTAEGILKNARGAPKDVGKKLLESSDTYLHFMDFFFDAMKNAAPKVDGGTAWPEAIRQYADGLLKSVRVDPTAWMRAGSVGDDVAELWKLFLGQLKFLGQPWLESMREAQGHVGEAMGGDRRAAIQMVNLFTDTFQSTVGKFLSAPAIGYAREYQEKLTKTFESWMDSRSAEAAFQAELTNTGVHALEALARAIQAKTDAGEKITSPKALFNLWVEIAEREYFRVASSEGFARLQATYVNATMHYRIHERVLFEEVYKACHLPTRTELDDGYRHLYEVRKEVKKLKLEVASLRREMAEAKYAYPAPRTEPTSVPPAAAATPAGKTSRVAGRKKIATDKTPAGGKE